MARVTSRYVPDNVSMARFLLSREVYEVAVDASEEIAEIAARSAARFSDTGRLAEGFDVEPIKAGEKMEGGLRWAARVKNDDPAAIANEVGNKRTPARHHLTNAAMPYHVPRRVRQ